MALRMRSSVRGDEPVASVTHTRRRATSVRRSSESRRSAVATEREASATSTMPGRTPRLGQSSAQLICLGNTVRTPSRSSASRSWPSMPCEKSAATTLWPRLPNGTDSAPVPQPMSNTVSPSRMPASSRNRST